MSIRRKAVACLIPLVAAAGCTDAPDPISADVEVAAARTSPRPGGPKALPERGAIVFTKEVGFRHDIFSIEEDRSNERRLTYDARINIMPAVSPDGQRIAYFSGLVPGLLDLYVMNIDGSNPRMLAALEIDVQRVSDLAWSPDGRTITSAFAFGEEATEMDLYTVNARSGKLTQLTSLPGEELWPTWSPDGRKLAFNMRNANGIFNVYKLDVDSGEITQYTECNVSCRQPKWSPDGSMIAWFDASVSSTVVASDAAHYIVFGTFPQGRHAVWSPDGARLAMMFLPNTLATASYNGSDLKIVQDDTGLDAPGGWARR